MRSVYYYILYVFNDFFFLPWNIGHQYLIKPKVGPLLFTRSHCHLNPRHIWKLKYITWGVSYKQSFFLLSSYFPLIGMHHVQQGFHLVTVLITNVHPWSTSTSGPGPIAYCSIKWRICLLWHVVPNWRALWPNMDSI